MIRYSIFVLAIVGTAATAIAAITPDHRIFDPQGRNITVIEKSPAGHQG